MGSPGAGTQGQLGAGWTVLRASPQVEKIRKAITSLDPVLRKLPDINLLKVRSWVQRGQEPSPPWAEGAPPAPGVLPSLSPAVPAGGLCGGVPGPGAPCHPHLHRAQLRRVPPARPDLQAGLPQEPQGTALPQAAPSPLAPPAPFWVRLGMGTRRCCRVKPSLRFPSQRLNVAITRAKALLIVVGNPAVLSKDRYWQR